MVEEQVDNRETKTSAPNISYIGKFDTPETPFTIHVEPIPLTGLLLELGMDENEVSKLNVQMAASDIPLSEGVEHPLSKIETKIVGPFMERVAGDTAGLTDTRTVAGKRTLTVFVGRIFKTVYSDAGSTIDEYFKQPSPKKSERVQELFTSKRVQQYLEKAPEDRAKEFLLYLSRIAAKRSMLDCLAHELQHAKDLGFPSKRKEFLNTAVVKYGSPIVIPQIVSAIALALAPRPSLRTHYQIIGLMIGAIPGTLKQACDHLEQARLESRADKIGTEYSTPPKLQRYLTIFDLKVNKEILLREYKPHN